MIFALKYDTGLEETPEEDLCLSETSIARPRACRPVTRLAAPTGRRRFRLKSGGLVRRICGIQLGQTITAVRAKMPSFLRPEKQKHLRQAFGFLIW